MRLHFNGWDLHGMLCPGWRLFSAVQFRVSSLWRDIGLSFFNPFFNPFFHPFFFLIVLAPIDSILRDTLLEGLNAFLNGIIMKQQNLYNLGNQIKQLSKMPEELDIQWDLRCCSAHIAFFLRIWKFKCWCAMLSADTLFWHFWFTSK